MPQFSRLRGVLSARFYCERKIGYQGGTAAQYAMVFWQHDARSESQGNPWRSREALCSRGEFYPEGRLSCDTGTASEPKRLRISGYGHCLYWSLGVISVISDLGPPLFSIRPLPRSRISTLFWINVLLGALLGFLTLAMAPAIAAFYREPQLFGVTAVLGMGFLFDAAGAQHTVLLMRQMRFTTLAVINVVSLAVGIAIAIYGAKAGYGYWALVSMSITPPIIGTIGLWLTTGWVPGMPRRQAGIRSMMRFGGSLTLSQSLSLCRLQC